MEDPASPPRRTAAPRDREGRASSDVDWQERSEARRAASEEARRRQQRMVFVVGALLAIALIALLAFGIAWGWRAAQSAIGGRPGQGGSTVDGGGGGAAAGGLRPKGASPGSSSPAARPAAPKPTSLIAFSTTPRLFTPSTIGNPFGKYRFIRETKLRIWTRRAVDEVKIVAVPPAAYTGPEAQAAGAAPVPITMVYKGALEKGLQFIPWTGQTKEGYALPRGIYRLQLEVLKDTADPRDVKRSAEATAELVTFVTIGNRTSKLVAITVDDGWNADPRLFELFRRENVPTTAFFIGGRGVADRNPQLVRTAMDAGMEIANHSLDHAWLLRLSDADIVRQATGARDILTPIAGYDHRWFRPSGGAMDPRAMQALYRAGVVPVQWSVDTEDTNGSRTPEHRREITIAAVRRLGSGTIILCHFGGHGTYELLERLISDIKGMGYGFGTMSQVMAGTPGFTAEGPLPAMVAPDPPR